jgi:3-oxoacyl-[acyl-carrier protein] reductase
VNIASTSGVGAEERAASYCAAKSGLIGLTRAMALDLAPHRIRVCAVAPGDIETPVSRRTRESDPRRYPKETPLGRGVPADVAAAVAYLAGPDGRFVTGTTLVLDGGLMAY